MCLLTCLLMGDPGDLFPGTSLAEGSRPGAQFSELFHGMETPTINPGPRLHARG